MSKFLDTLDPKYYNQLTEANIELLSVEAPFRFVGREKIQINTSRRGGRRSSALTWHSNADFNDVIARCYARHLKQLLSIPGVRIKPHKRINAKEGIYLNTYVNGSGVRSPRVQAGFKYDLKSFNLDVNSTGDDFFRAYQTAKYWRRVYMITGVKPDLDAFKGWRTRRLYEEPYDAETQSVG